MKYALDNERVVHAVSPLESDRTLCGNAEEGVCFRTEADDLAWTPIKHGPVTCQACVTIIVGLRGIRVKV